MTSKFHRKFIILTYLFCTFQIIEWLSSYLAMFMPNKILHVSQIIKSSDKLSS